MENEIYSILVGPTPITVWWILIFSGFILSLICIFYLALKGVSMFVNGVFLGLCGFFFIVASYSVHFLDVNSRNAAKILSSDSFEILDVFKDKNGKVSKITISSSDIQKEKIPILDEEKIITPPTLKAAILSENFDNLNAILSVKNKTIKID